MRIMHISMGGCLSAPPVKYGMTEDTGGHIAYVLGAAMAQAKLPEVEEVTIVTRLFDAPELGAVFAQVEEGLRPSVGWCVWHRIGLSIWKRVTWRRSCLRCKTLC